MTDLEKTRDEYYEAVSRTNNFFIFLSIVTVGFFIYVLWFGEITLLSKILLTNIFVTFSYGCYHRGIIKENVDVTKRLEKMVEEKQSKKEK